MDVRYDSSMYRSLIFLLLLLLLVLVLVSLAPATSAVSPVSLQLADATDADAAATRAQEMTGGRVLDVKTEVADGAVVYLVKILLDDGHVRVVRIAGHATSSAVDDAE